MEDRTLIAAAIVTKLSETSTSTPDAKCYEALAMADLLLADTLKFSPFKTLYIQFYDADEALIEFENGEYRVIRDFNGVPRTLEVLHYDSIECYSADAIKSWGYTFPED